MKLADILKDSSYKLSQFTPTEIEQLEQTITLKKTKNGEAPYTICLVRKKEIKLTPEEAIRQLYLRVLSDRLNYPLSRIQVEYGVNFGREVKRADIAVMDKDRLNTVYILVEVKSPKWKDGKAQLRSYCNGTGSPMAVWTNGDQISYYQRKDPNYFEDISDIPNSNQTLADILQIKFTLDDLIANDKLVKRNKSLKTLIEEMEDEVLANAGVDVFEELFKLIFAKLYDEWYSGQGNRRRTRLLEFRNTGQTEAALKNKIQDLFDRAKKKWPGIFSEDVKIGLAPSHLSVCVSSLEDAKLFNSNLDVIDEAFEYLINQSSKGEKGQFFTPRYVIDLCVKMLNPQEDEYMIDTAAGSSGFPVHTIFHVWRQILEDEGLEASHLFSLEEKPPRCKEYVEEKVFAIDFDEKAVRVARTLNLIAGDGQTNVLHLNTLDYELWDEVTKEDDWQNVYFAGFNRLKKLRPKGSKDYREFQFDILMANPPFAGDIRERRIIARYELTKDKAEKTKGVGRDILFIERNLDFLKPGGRMAIVLPQGRFNNSSDKNIRDFIAERCRILAVVGLHGNTFKPHTGTKTSVLLVQKWNDDPKIGALCPRQDDYNIFFATMQKSGKDNSGEKVYVKVSDDSGDFLLDKHNHWIVDHDLFNHDGLTEDGIAEAFIEFAKKENLSFFEIPPANATPLNKGDRGGAFDAVKYQQLMDRIEAVEVVLSQALKNKDFRIDSEFHRRHPLQNPNYSYVDIGENLTLIQYGISIEMNEEGEGIKIYRMNEIHNMLCDTEVSKFANISSVDIESFKLRDRDVLFNRTNSFEFVGRTGIFKSFSDEDLVFASYLIRVRTEESKILPEYLVAFLNSKLGIWDLKRRARISINQSNINAQELAAVKIPLLNIKFQIKLKKLFEKAHCDRLKAIAIYQQAEDLLLTELGLKDWKPTEESIAVKSFSESFLSSGRLDAEYYQPKYDEIETTIMKYGFIELIKISKNVSTGFTYDSADFVDNGIDIIRINNITQYGLDLSNSVKISPDNSSLRLKDKVAPGAILISMSGSIGLCCCIQDEINAFINQRIMKLYPVDFDGNVLAMIINSVIGKMQLHRVGTGGVQTNLSNSDILNLKIPKLPVSVQQSMSQSINKSLNFRQKSKQLLEIAKIGVEKAIETEEETATAWINQQLESLDISPLFKGGRGDQ
ncbi:N-6 DNA methylase [Microcystis aeruginosa NIES-298]|uniref:Type I restriction modification system, N-6 DNA Methylase n=1 Tax=Microcystis aeruginosa NIES-298 TaxID=449468 RepID=A0A2H6BSY9_MICAE|nr:N-6 DNA methylase [Microcystis aeruginosa]QHU84392.1 N-6 DNA methylase [Microcystis aeruginosa NIES-298]GBD53290.1 type I restriction modification system, N-6 DNA Methylase [Microcystis aeruginosa NIES-298]GBE99994.1 DNA methylase [Microcystis aeruginosa NIES-298]